VDAYTVTITPQNNGHPCPKPILLFKWLMTAASNEAAIILDPFLGSGTTAVAAKQLGRKFIGIEIEEKYCRIAVDRLRQGVLGL
jgi:site-specific DNA-methyltransferase (adenine-specific)